MPTNAEPTRQIASLKCSLCGHAMRKPRTATEEPRCTYCGWVPSGRLIQADLALLRHMAGPDAPEHYTAKWEVQPDGAINGQPTVLNVNLPNAVQKVLRPTFEPLERLASLGFLNRQASAWEGDRKLSTLSVEYTVSVKGYRFLLSLEAK